MDKYGENISYTQEVLPLTLWENRIAQLSSVIPEQLKTLTDSERQLFLAAVALDHLTEREIRELYLFFHPDDGSKVDNLTITLANGKSFRCDPLITIFETYLYYNPDKLHDIPRAIRKNDIFDISPTLFQAIQDFRKQPLRQLEDQKLKLTDRLDLMTNLFDDHTKKVLAFYNQEYLRLIPEFYFYLESGNETTAKAILQQIISQEEKYLSLIKKVIETNINIAHFPFELRQQLDAGQQDIIINSLANSFRIHHFKNMPADDLRAHSDASSFYQSFHETKQSASNDQLYSSLKENYLGLRTEIAGIKSPATNPQAVKDFFKSKEEIEKEAFSYRVSAERLTNHPYLPMKDYVTKPQKREEVIFNDDLFDGYNVNQIIDEFRKIKPDLSEEECAQDAIRNNIDFQNFCIKILSPGRKEYFRDLNRGQMIFGNGLQFNQLIDEFRKIRPDLPLTAFEPDVIVKNINFQIFYINILNDCYGENNISTLIKHYSQGLRYFGKYALTPFLNYHSNKPFIDGKGSQKIYPVFTGDVIELRCVAVVETIKSSDKDKDTLEKWGWLQGISEESFFTEQNNRGQAFHIKFPGIIESRWRFDGTGFVFVKDSVTTSNKVFAQLADGTAAYGINKDTADNPALFPDGFPPNNKAYSFADMVNCVNKQEKLRNKDREAFFGMPEAISEFDQIIKSAISFFGSYASAGKKLMKEILTDKGVDASLIAILEEPASKEEYTRSSVDRFYLKQQAADFLKELNAETLKNSDYLISGWEKEIANLLSALGEKSALNASHDTLEYRVIYKIPDSFYQKLTQQQIYNLESNGISIEKHDKPTIIMSCSQYNSNDNEYKKISLDDMNFSESEQLRGKLSEQFIQNYSEVLETYDLSKKLTPTYQIKTQAELAGKDIDHGKLGDAAKKTARASTIHNANAPFYAKERHPGRRNVLYIGEVVLAICTAFLYLAAMGTYNYLTKGTFTVFKQDVSADILKSSYQKAGIKIEEVARESNRAP